MILNACQNISFACWISEPHQVGGSLGFIEFLLWRIWVFEPPSRNRQRRLPSKSDTLGGITEEEPLVPNQKHLWFNLSLTQLVSSSVTNYSVKWNLPINTLQHKWQSLLERVAINTLPGEILPANTNLRVMELLKGQTHKILVSRSFHIFSL